MYQCKILIMTTNHDYIIRGRHYETGERISIIIKNGIISDLSPTSDKVSDDSENLIMPGLIDSQINGYYSIDFAEESVSSDSLKKAAMHIWRDGVTTFLPTLITGSHENLVRNFGILSAMIKDEYYSGSVPGFHLEGPFLSKEAGFYGCHPVEYLRKPSWEEFTEYQEAAEGHILIVTVSPELEGAMDFIRRCSDSGVLVSIGHTNATAEQISEAVDNGARMSTHLGNGCANMIHRHNNPIWPQLANDLLTPSIIADGHHLLPEEIKVFYRVKGANNLILTSDVTHLIGMEPGEYVYMGSRIIMTREGLIKNPELNCLAGDSFPLKKGIETMMNVTDCGFSRAVNLASGNVAKLLHLDDRGELLPGKRADIVVGEMKNNKLNILQVFIAGKKVF